MVAVLEALDSSDSVALNSPRRARVVDEAGLEEIEMCDAGVDGATYGNQEEVSAPVLRKMWFVNYLWSDRRQSKCRVCPCAVPRAR